MRLNSPLKKKCALVSLIAIITFTAQSQTTSYISKSQAHVSAKADEQVAIQAVSNLVSFSGAVIEGKAKLKWTLTEGNTASTVILEKSTTGKEYQPVAEFWVNMEGNTETNFNYTDKKSAVYYRLTIIAKDGKIQYSDVVNAGSSKML
ncbi:MAG: hypothetical protein WDO16_23180 [Bacteroidota bacterium]